MHTDMTQASNPDPVFICGLPRSGTTLLTSLLDSHSSLAVFPEETWLARSLLPKRTPNREVLIEDLFTKTPVRFLNPERDIRSIERIGGLGVVDYGDFDFPHFRALVRERFAASQGTPAELLRILFQSYGELTDQAHKRYCVEKSPFNEKFIAHIRRAWSAPRFIYILRDPRAVYLSRREKNLKQDKPLTLQQFIHEWIGSMNAWVSDVADYPHLLIRYEDLIHAREATLRRICQHLAIPFELTLLTPTKNGNNWTGISSSGAEVHQEHQVLGSNWQHQLTNDEVRLIETCLGKIMVQFDYQLSAPLPTSSSFLTNMRGYARQGVLRDVWRLYSPFARSKR